MLYVTDLTNQRETKQFSALCNLVIYS